MTREHLTVNSSLQASHQKCSSGWFKHIEPTSSNLRTITEIAMCVGCLCTSSGWFKHIEPPSYHVLPYPTPSNHILPCLTFVLRCFLLPSYTGSYPVLPQPTTSNHILPCRTFLPHPTLYPTATLPHIKHSPTLSYPS